MAAKAIERAELEQQMAEFLARGGQIQQVGAQMVDKVPFVINAKTTPVYTPQQATPVVQPASKVVRQYRARPDDESIAVKIILEAALGGTPVEIAQSLRISLSRCRAIAEQYRVQFHG